LNRWRHLQTDPKATPAEAVVFIFVPLDPDTDGIVNAKKKGTAANVPTSLVGNADNPHDGWRRPG
jgi:hypothetical protein